MKILLYLFLMHVSLIASAQESLIEVNGIVTSNDTKLFGMSDNKITIKNLKETVVLDFNKLDYLTKKQLLSADAKKTVQNIKYKKSAQISRKETTMGIRADCSEIPTSMDDLESIAKNSKDMMDFLNKIPQGSLQGFTFVTNSLSLHRGKQDANGEGQVSPMWPRVLRSSMDGKITVSFVCDPKNPTFGKVEIISFDDKEKEFKTTEFDFGHPTTGAIAPENRIHKNPESCISCHAGSEVNGKVSLKPNWQEYFQWSDCEDDNGIQMYGGNDDNMGSRIRFGINGAKKCTADKFEESTKKERANFIKFRELQKNNACFNSLPWPDESKVIRGMNENWTYKYYPYSEYAQDNMPREARSDTQIIENGTMNYSLRTNLRFTDTYSHLMGIRNANILKKNPDYEKIKYFLAMEGAECEIDNSQLKKLYELIPELIPDLSQVSKGQYSEYKSRFPIMEKFSQYAGLKPLDWTMNFQEKNKIDYNAAIPSETSGFDMIIPDIVSGETLKDIASTNPVFANAAKNNLSKGVTKQFGTKFSCIDDLGGGIVPSREDDEKEAKKEAKKFCNLLSSENKKHLKKLGANVVDCIDCKKLEIPTINKSLENSLEEAVRKLTADQVDRGKKLVEADSKGKCVMCHSASVDMLPKDFRFIPSELDKNKAESVAIMRARKNEMAKKIENRLIKTKTMPPIENDLTDQDRQDVQAYLLSIAAGK